MNYVEFFDENDVLLKSDHKIYNIKMLKDSS